MMGNRGKARNFGLIYLSAVLIHGAFSICLAQSADEDTKTAQLASQPAESHASSLVPPFGWDHATDDWFGLRPKLEDHGVVFAATLISDWAKNLTGGINTEGYNFADLFNASFTLDTQKLGGWPGGQVFALFQNENGEFATADVGDVQVVDNIDADGRTQLAELWYEQELLREKLCVRVGKINVNGDFASVEHGATFLQSSMGISPTVLAIPKYPDPAMGVQIWADPNEHFYAAFGLFDGALHEGIETGSHGPATFFGKPSDLFLIGEAGLKSELGPDKLPGKLGVGVWHHTGRFDRFDGGTDGGATGFYLVADQTIYKENPSEKDDGQGIGVFFQYGWADANISPIEQHFGFGMAWTGAIPSRDDDICGIGLSCALLSQKNGAGFNDPAETAIELFYSAKLIKWMSIQPDIQYVINPGGVSRNADAVVFILRVTIDL